MIRPILGFPGWRGRISSRHASGMTWLFLIFFAVPWTRGDETPLNLADLADYRRALTPRDSEPRPTVVSYRELWEHPERYQGTRIQVEGRIVRRFRQGTVGTFPPLVEAWAVTPLGEPFCWVYPAPKAEAPAVRDSVRFVGTYLKRIRYQGADVDRLAPLIVGPRPPASLPRAASRPNASSGHYSVTDWILGTAAAVIVMAVLAWQHLRKPISRLMILESEPPPLFEPTPSELRVREEHQDEAHDEKRDD
jgi:hypothetical protein